MEGTKEIVQSFGLHTKEMGIGLLILANIQRYMSSVRATAKREGRASDARRSIVNALVTCSVGTPDKKTGKPNRDVNQPTDQSLLKFLGLPAGSHHLLKQCRKNRLSTRLDGVFNLLGPRRKWTKVPLEVWHEIRTVWLPSCKEVKSIPPKGDTIMLRDINGKYIFAL